MVTISYGPGLPGVGYADNTSVGTSQFLTRINSIRFTYESSTEVDGDYRLLAQPGLQSDFYGYGFTYSNTGGLTGGTVTKLVNWLNGALISQLDGLSVSINSLISWVGSGDYVSAGNAIYAGNDLIYAPTGHSAFNGYGGIDTVVLPDAFRQTTVSGYAPTQATVSSADLSDSLTSIERLQFVDGTLYYDNASPAAMVTRLYQAALGRPSDGIGLSYWTSALQNGASLVQLADGFIGSPEFQARFPGASQGATPFVTQLYANVLHRAPDQTGLNYWLGQLQSGRESQAQVLGDFSESPENIGNTQPVISAGVWVANEQAASVARLYYSALNRAPDAGGLRGWTAMLQSGQTLVQEAVGFMASPEFQGKYGTLNNADFVSLMYQNVLGRPAEPTGQADWTNLLNAGATRASVLVGFSESTEHQILLMPKIEAAGVILS